ncbi:MAG: hypothetical protein KDK04_02940 [Candidatus Competibacteraceae bacterium]|nr:hypothetical protein [Candidatus Competibacteraceae bacterium]
MTPITTPPYQSLVREIIQGIGLSAGEHPVIVESIATDHTPGELRHWLGQVKPAVVITLGREPTQRFEALQSATPQLIGLLDLTPQTRPKANGISLAIDPTQVFETFQLLALPVHRVHVVFNPRYDQWLVDLAHKRALDYGFVLQPYSASNLEQAIPQFQHIFNTMDAASEVLWLLADNQLVDTDIVLPFIVEKAWVHRVMVISNNLLHTRLGILLGLYPDNIALGQALGQQALALMRQPDQALGIRPMTAVKRAINLRIAVRLGLTVNRAVQEHFDLVISP